MKQLRVGGIRTPGQSLPFLFLFFSFPSRRVRIIDCDIKRSVEQIARKVRNQVGSPEAIVLTLDIAFSFTLDIRNANNDDELHTSERHDFMKRRSSNDTHGIIRLRSFFLSFKFSSSFFSFSIYTDISDKASESYYFFFLFFINDRNKFHSRNIS